MCKNVLLHELSDASEGDIACCCAGVCVRPDPVLLFITVISVIRLISMCLICAVVLYTCRAIDTTCSGGGGVGKGLGV